MLLYDNLAHASDFFYGALVSALLSVVDFQHRYVSDSTTRIQTAVGVQVQLLSTTCQLKRRIRARPARKKMGWICGTNAHPNSAMIVALARAGWTSRQCSG